MAELPHPTVLLKRDLEKALLGEPRPRDLMHVELDDLPDRLHVVAPPMRCVSAASRCARR